MKKVAKIFLYLIMVIFALNILIELLKPQIREQELKRAMEIQKERTKLPLNKLSPPLAFSGNIENIKGTNYVVIFDDSGSMSGKKLREAKNALRFFLQNLKPLDTVSMIALHSGIFKGKKEIFQNFESIEADGGTPLGRALKSAKDYILELVKKNEGYGKYVIISISDGVATDISENELNRLLKSIYQTKEADILLKTIGFHMDSDNMLNSIYTQYIEANSMQDLQNAFKQILAEDNSFSKDGNVTFK